MTKISALWLNAIATLGLVSCEAQTTSEKAAPSLADNPIQNPASEHTAEPDLINGRRQFAKCKVCHTLKNGERHKVGPNLYGVFGHAAASKEGFRYSRALKNAGLVWDEDTLDTWINNPRKFVPGTIMSFMGIRDDTSRRDLLAYLAGETAPTPSIQD